MSQRAANAARAYRSGVDVLGPIDEGDAAPTGPGSAATATSPAAAPLEPAAPGTDTAVTGDRAHWDDNSEAMFQAHARRVLSARWGTALEARAVGLTGGTTHSLGLVSGNGRIVGDVLWLDGLPSAQAKWSVVAESVWLLGHVVRADRRLLVVGHDWDVLSRWLASYRPLLEGVEIWYLDGDRLERMA